MSEVRIEGVRWYVVHTYSGYENKVASTLMTTVENRGLQDMIQEVKIPTETIVEYKKVLIDSVKKLKGKERKNAIEELGEDAYKIEEVLKEEKIYPSYVFVKMIYTDETWYVVRNIRGCTGFVGPSSKPIPLSDEEAEKMGVEIPVVAAPCKTGDKVLVIDGPFENFEAVVDRVDMDNKIIHATILMFGRDTPVELQFEQVELKEEKK